MTISRLSDGKFVEANGAFVRWFGLDRDGILGHDSQELGLWLSREARAKFWADLRSNGSVHEVECQYRTHRGAVHTMLVSADIIEVNCEPHVLGLFLDVTERKRVETEWIRTLAREKELSKLRSNFVSMVSHEFQTPLGIIQSSAEILEDYLDQLERSERKDHLQSIRNNLPGRLSAKRGPRPSYRFRAIQLRLALPPSIFNVEGNADPEAVAAAVERVIDERNRRAAVV